MGTDGQENGDLNEEHAILHDTSENGVPVSMDSSIEHKSNESSRPTEHVPDGTEASGNGHNAEDLSQDIAQPKAPESESLANGQSEILGGHDDVNEMNTAPIEDRGEQESADRPPSQADTFTTAIHPEKPPAMPIEAAEEAPAQEKASNGDAGEKDCTHAEN